ncbi:MAG: flavodoxin [Actinobacteria bacterium]|nr:MAG: flavodoxin [Actinomycetota bacterium]
MASSILVSYATRYGSTQEVADAIGARLRELGFQVDVRPVRDVAGLEGYDAVVLGTPFYIGSMLKDARQFLERHRAGLEQMPVAIFALGPTRREEDMEAARAQLDEALAKTPWLKAVAAEMFVGKYDPARLRFLDKLVAILPASPLHGVGAHDERDWDAIGAWANGLPAALHLQTQ